MNPSRENVAREDHLRVETMAVEGGGEDGNRLPFARGGPIYVPDLVGSPTSVHEFQSSLLHELQSLEAELVGAGGFEDELSVDELKVFTEEELVEKALKENFENLPSTDDKSKLLEGTNGGLVDHSCLSSEDLVCREKTTNDTGNLESSVCICNSSVEKCSNNIIEKNAPQKKKKRGRVFDRNSRAAELEGSYFAKVEQLKKLKQKQEEDKLAARLHSFSGNSKFTEGTGFVLENTERMRSLRFITTPAKLKSSSSQENVPLCYPEVLLCVEIYHKKNNSMKTQEFLVLGRQLLTELRDNIYCQTVKLMQISGKHDPSGYFLIENTFYNDLRDPSAIDYSKPIFDWLENCKDEVSEKWKYIMSGELKKKQKELLGDVEVPCVPDFKVADMQKTHFSDLCFRLGAGYIYCHQGNCKHMIVIRDMRLVHPEDAQNQAGYPLLTFQIRPRYKKCSVCKISHATKMTIDDKWAPKNPCYFCIKCYFLLHYKEDNSLLYPHLVYDYHHE
ncbi:putative snRNA-activating protein complex, subunit 3 [Dioscorea sansibarensis]